MYDDVFCKRAHKKKAREKVKRKINFQKGKTTLNLSFFLRISFLDISLKLGLAARI